MKKKLLATLFALIFTLSTSLPSFAATDFTPKAIQNESQAVYDLNLKMEKNGDFQIVSKAAVKNLSQQGWSEIPFYFIPNVFSKENHPVKQAGDITKLSITVNKKKADYQLGRDQIQVNLQKPLEPGETADIEIKYTLKLPNSAYRLLKSNNNYYLAQWYPMLPAFYNGGWNIRAYYPTGESYHTTHTSFKLTYNLLDGFQLASSSEQDTGSIKGTVKGSNIKDMYIAVLNKDFTVKSRKAGDTEIRVFGKKDNPKLMEYSLDLGTEAFSFFEKNIGDYPMKQLDIVLTENSDTGHMEYPGIVTVIADSIKNSTPEEEMKWQIQYPLVHEVGHQWFYGVVNNDPYTDAWVDEGINELLTEMFFYSKDPNPLNFSDYPWLEKEYGIKKPSNLDLPWYAKYEYSSLIYTVPYQKMWKLFSEHGGYEKGIQFLSDYYKTYSFKQLDTEEFVRFAMNYFKLDNDLSFREWLKLKGYPDVPKDHYAFEDINKLKMFGFPIEASDGNLHPFDDITRYDAARFLAYTKGLEEPEDSKLDFIDIKKEDPNYPVISGIVKEGYIKADQQFYPDKPLTAEELSLLLAHAVNKGTLTLKPNDFSGTHWLAKYIELDASGKALAKPLSKDENIKRIDFLFIASKFHEAAMAKYMEQ